MVPSIENAFLLPIDLCRFICGCENLVTLIISCKALLEPKLSNNKQGSLVNEGPVLLLLLLVLHLELVSRPALEDVLHHGEVGAEDGESFEEPDRLPLGPVDRLLPLDPAAVVRGLVTVLKNLQRKKNW